MKILDKIHYLGCAWFIGKGIYILFWSLFYLINHGWGQGAEFMMIYSILSILIGIIFIVVFNLKEND